MILIDDPSLGNWRALTRDAVPITGHSLALIGVGDNETGDWLPVIELDTSQRPDLRELPRLQALEPDRKCDFRLQWHVLTGLSPRAALALEFTRPADARCVIELSLLDDLSLIEHMLLARGWAAFAFDPANVRNGGSIVIPTRINDVGETVMAVAAVARMLRAMGAQENRTPRGRARRGNGGKGRR